MRGIPVQRFYKIFEEEISKIAAASSIMAPKNPGNSAANVNIETDRVRARLVKRNPDKPIEEIKQIQELS